MELKYTTRVETQTRIQFIELEAYLQTLIPQFSQIVLICDKAISINFSIPTSVLFLAIEATEHIKTFIETERLISNFIDWELDKKSAIIAIGGGALTDLAGFTASIYLRGIAFITIPSTLLGMVDAAIGGKNGINYHNKKNQVGTISQPVEIGIDLNLLQSLPLEEFSNGMAEVIKYGCIADGKILDLLEQTTLENLKLDTHRLKSLLEKCITIKSRIVEQDTLDKDLRKILNFGHSFGHAIEKKYQLSHGQSVGLGILFALKISEISQHLHPNFTSRIRTLFAKYLLPTTLSYDPETVFGELIADKKRSSNTIDYILLDKNSSPMIVPILLEKIKEYLHQSIKERWILH